MLYEVITVSSVGSYVDRFEQRVSEYVGTDFGVATVNGTAALHLSLLACGVQPGDEVIAPAFTFIAPINAIHYCGASPVFIGSDADTVITSYSIHYTKLYEIFRSQTLRSIFNDRQTILVGDFI